MKLTLQWQLKGQPQEKTLIAEENLTIGRHPTCQITFPDEVQYRTIGRRHAEIYVQQGAFYLRNLNRKNRIRFTGQQRLGYNETRPLRPGDAFRLGPVEFRVVDLQAQAGQTHRVRCLECHHIVDRNLLDCPHCGTSLAFAETTIQE